MKKLIINADDFGYTGDVNEGIVEAHRNGVLTATTLMANAAAFDGAVALAKANPSLDVGCHLVLIGGRSLLNNEPYPATPRSLLKRLALGRLNVEKELRAQIEKTIRAGIRPSHLDTHKHTHLVPSVFRVVCRLAREFAVPYVRLSLDETVRLSGFNPVRTAWLYRRIAGKLGVRLPDHFLGFRLTGRLDEHSLAAALPLVREGLTEFMCHPGRLGVELQSAPTRLKRERQTELEALTSPRIRKLVVEQGISLASFRG